jgi:hypothetical protein
LFLTGPSEPALRVPSEPALRVPSDTALRVPSDCVHALQDAALVGEVSTPTLASAPSSANFAGAHEISTPQASAAPGLATPPEAKCIDLSDDCAAWADMGECSGNPAFMHVKCARACDACGSLEFGAARAAATLQASEPPKKKCTDKATECALWARNGECLRNPRYMQISCASSCDTCEWADYDKRCKTDPNATLALPEGAIGALFRAMDGGALAQFKPRVMSRPPAPWLVVFDSFLPEVR